MTARSLYSKKGAGNPESTSDFPSSFVPFIRLTGLAAPLCNCGIITKNPVDVVAKRLEKEVGWVAVFTDMLRPGYSLDNAISVLLMYEIHP